MVRAYEWIKPDRNSGEDDRVNVERHLRMGFERDFRYRAAAELNKHLVLLNVRRTAGAPAGEEGFHTSCDSVHQS